MKKTKIAILGATSHIAKGLVNNFLQDGEFDLHLYARSPDKVRRFLNVIKKSAGKKSVIRNGYADFLKYSYDVVINCVGIGTLNKFKGDYSKYFTVTEKFDNLAVEYLQNVNSDALYISFSSGAVYGRKCQSPAQENTENCLRVNHIIPQDYYAISRLNAEAKHRSFKNLKIVDLRLFSYFSRFIDLTDGYFITELLNCILEHKIFMTDSANFTRDYLHPKDLHSAVIKCMKIGKINAAFDIVSAKPVSKKEIIDYFSAAYGLKYKISRRLKAISATGKKNIFCSKYNNAKKIGYKPAFSSMDTIQQESKYILLDLF